MRQSFRVAGLAATAAALIVAAAPASAAVIPGWYSSTDVSFVAATGNSETLNFGLTTNLTRQWLRTAWRTTASYIRAEAADERRAVGSSATNFGIETAERVTKSEKLFANSNFERRVTESFYWNIGAGAERDPFAGLKYRVLGQAGVGYLWLKTDNSARFQAGIAGTYTAQEEVRDDPETEDNFVGLRATLSGEKRFGDRNQNIFNSELIGDQNLQDSDDLRFVWNNGLSVSMTQRLALKVGLQVSFDNLPALAELPLFLRLANGALVETNVKVPARAEKTDVTGLVSLVINITPGGAQATPNR